MQLTAKVAVEMCEISKFGEPHRNRPADRISPELCFLQVNHGFHTWWKVRHIVEVNVYYLQPRQCIEGGWEAAVKTVPLNVQLSDAAPAVGSNLATDPLPLAD
mgnify:CR=1 FL=1